MIAPWRDVALSTELGDRVLADLMTLEDWLDMIGQACREPVRSRS